MSSADKMSSADEMSGPAEPSGQSHRRSEYDIGLAAGASAHLIWGMFPVFFGLLAPAGALEVLSHRVLWTAVLMVAGLAVAGRLRRLRLLDGRTLLLVAVAATLISVNWGVYIYGVLSGHVVDTALGYFINPLVSVLFGVLFFKERLSRAQIVALALAGAAVVVLTVDYGRPPVIALVLALTFAGYGLVKKVVPLDPGTSLAAESLVLSPVAIGFLVFLAVTGTGTFLGHGAGHSLLLMASGAVTAIPLLLFGVAVQRVPLSTMGVLQYLTPTLQMIWGVAVLHEPMPPARWIGFGLIWLALMVFTADALRARRARRTA